MSLGLFRCNRDRPLQLIDLVLDVFIDPLHIINRSHCLENIGRYILQHYKKQIKVVIQTEKYLNIVLFYEYFA